MKKTLSIFLLLFSIFFSHAQKELWGVNTGDGYNVGYYGNITKYDINGENPAIMHEFDSNNGYSPVGKLFLASNGKLYGTTLYGGNPTASGVFFEYNLILDKFRVIYNFDYTTNPVSVNPIIGVIEPIPGQLYGATANRVFKYDIASGVLTFYNALPIDLLNITTEFIKASDGNLYSTAGYATCPTYPSSSLWGGCIIKFNMTTNNLSVVHALNCDPTIEGVFPNGVIEASPGILYGITLNGGIYYPQFGQPNNPAGVLFEYNISTNLYTKKIDFNSYNAPAIGGAPNTLINGGNGKLYGLCSEGGVPQTCNNPTYHFGTLFEYTPTTNVLEVKQNFAFCGNTVRYPTSLMQTSLGHFMGTIPAGGLFKYDAPTNLVTMPVYTSSNINLYNAANLIEICRKPSYHEFIPDIFTPSTGSAFTYDIQNTNATTYVWQKGTTILPLQTTAILNLPSVTTADSGVYTCTMTNECGTSTTMNLYINVDNLSTQQVNNYKDKITLYPNPTKGILNIKLTQNDIIITKAIITNMLGQVVYSDEISRNQVTTNIKLDTSKLESGIYNLTLKTDKGDWNVKFVKE